MASCCHVCPRMVFVLLFTPFPSSFNLTLPYVTQCGSIWPCMSFYGRILSFLAVIDPNSFGLVLVNSNVFIVRQFWLSYFSLQSRSRFQRVRGMCKKLHLGKTSKTTIAIVYIYITSGNKQDVRYRESNIFQILD